MKNKLYFFYQTENQVVYYGLSYIKINVHKINESTFLIALKQDSLTCGYRLSAPPKPHKFF